MLSSIAVRGAFSVGRSYARSIAVCRFFSTPMEGGRPRVSVEFHGKAAVLRMQHGDNRVVPEFVRDFNAALDEIERNKEVKVLITTGEGKFFSNGLDLQNLISSNKAEETGIFMLNVLQLLARILTFRTVTIAALNGHTYAMGALLALAHDHRLMRMDRGWFCLPEVYLKVPFTTGLVALAKAKLPPAEHLKCIVMGKKYTGEEALRAGIVSHVCPSTEVMDAAMKMAKTTAKENYDGNALSMLKHNLYEGEFTALHGPLTYSSKL